MSLSNITKAYRVGRMGDSGQSGCVYTVHTARILQSPPGNALFHERGQPLSVAALSGQSFGQILNPGGVVAVVRGGNTADCRSFGLQDISSSGLATLTLIFFYLRTNNAIK